MQLKSCLRTLGFSATNDIFAENAWYFRNALVRANYTNLQKGIHETTEYLEVFFRNLLLNEKNELHNRNLHISGLLNEEKVDMGNAKVDIENEKVDIESVLSEKGSNFSVKTTVHIHRLFEKFGFDEVFRRSAVMELLELKGSGASKLLSNLQKFLMELGKGYAFVAKQQHIHTEKQDYYIDLVFLFICNKLNRYGILMLTK